MAVYTFTTPGSFTQNFPSAGSAVVECWGGGQAGGDNAGAGGKGGSYSKKTISVNTSGYTLVVGAGGTSAGANGGDSYFVDSATCLAKGGNSASTNTGDLSYTGGNGGASNFGNGGGGGSSAGTASNGNNGNAAGLLAGGAGGAAVTGGGAGGDGGAFGENGFAGTAPGGGGGGAGTGGTGGAGASGQIIITFTADPVPPPPPPPPPPPEPPPPEPPPPVDEPPHNLIIRDKTGRLPKNPKDWPSGLKAAVAGCCGCGESSSSGSSSSGGGPNINNFCCGCDYLLWPQLVATVTSSKLGTFTVPLTGGLCGGQDPLHVVFEGIYAQGQNNNLTLSYNCLGLIGGGYFPYYDRFVRVRLQCIRCLDGRKLWLVYALVHGIISNEGHEHWVGRVANLSSCDPVVFDQIFSTSICSTPGVYPQFDCCTGGRVPILPPTGNNIIQCTDHAQTFFCVGETITVDISE